MKPIFNANSFRTLLGLVSDILFSFGSHSDPRGSFKSAAQKLGLHYTPLPLGLEKPLGAALFLVPRGNHKQRNAVECPTAIGTLTVFDQVKFKSSSELEGYGPKTLEFITTAGMIKLPEDALPMFSLSPRLTVLSFFKGETALKNTQMKEIDFRKASAFSSAFRLSGYEPEKLRQIFERCGPHFVSYFRKWSIEVVQNQLICYRINQAVPEVQLEGFIRDVLRIADILLDKNETTTVHFPLPAQ